MKTAKSVFMQPVQNLAMRCLKKLNRELILGLHRLQSRLQTVQPCSSCAVLNGHKAVQCDSYEIWIHNECSYISLSEYETLENTNCTWICPKCVVLNFSDSHFDTQCNFEQSNMFDPLVKDMNKASSAPSTNKTTSLNGLKFVSLNFNCIRGKKLELLAFLDYHKLDIVAIQETKIDGSISASELFPDSCPYNAYRKDRNLHGGSMMLLIHKEIPHLPLTELENDSELVWAKVFANKTSH